MYLTRAGEVGVGNHFDPHDVLAIQIFGQKRWRVKRLSSTHMTQNYNRFVTREHVSKTEFTYYEMNDEVTEQGASLCLKTGDLHNVEAISDSAHIAAHHVVPTINDLIGYYLSL